MINIWIGITICLTLLVFFIASLSNQKRQHEKEIEALMETFRIQEDLIREDAIKRSKAVNKGNVSEQLIPLFADFPYRVADCKFFGKPLDYVVYSGMEAFANREEGAQIEIIFADVKTGKSVKTRTQREIEKAIKEKRVRFETWKINDDNKITIS